jgi:hypothetical protein
MKALIDCVSASLRQSATIDQLRQGGAQLQEFQTRPSRAAHAVRQQGKFVPGRDSGDMAGPAVVLVTDARPTPDGDEQIFEMLFCSHHRATFTGQNFEALITGMAGVDKFPVRKWPDSDAK